MLPLLLKKRERIACCWESWVWFWYYKIPCFLSVFRLLITFEKVLLFLMMFVAQNLLYQVVQCLWNSNQKSKHVFLHEWVGPVNRELENGMAGAPLGVSLVKDKVKYRQPHVSAGTIHNRRCSQKIRALSLFSTLIF